MADLLLLLQCVCSDLVQGDRSNATSTVSRQSQQSLLTEFTKCGHPAPDTGRRSVVASSARHACDPVKDWQSPCVSCLIVTARAQLVHFVVDVFVI